MQKTILVLLTIVSGCGSVSHKLTLSESYKPETGALIEVGKVTNETGKVFDIDLEQMLTDALTNALRKEKLLPVDGDGHRLVLTSRIVEYNKGSAFKRWLLPGWGTTVIAIEGDLVDGQQVVGSFRAKRTISVGGGYTIGAWRTVFASIARDVVKDFRSKRLVK